MPTERLLEVEDRLSRAITTRGMTYVNREAVIFYFENDDTHAHKDAYVLKSCLEDTFGIRSTIIQISKKDSSPAFTIRGALSNMYLRMAPVRHGLPSLMIMGYVGHGTMDNASGMVKFVSANGRQNALWSYIAQQWFSGDPSLEKVDSLAILDCCYAGAARQKHTRTSQVLAACGPNETARSRSAGFISFSQRFQGACRSLAAQEHQAFTTTDTIYDEMCRLRPANAPQPRIEHLGHSGRIISLPFQTARPREFRQSLQTSSDYHLLVQLSVGGEPGEDAEKVAEKFDDTLLSLPSQYQVEIVSAYESTSVLFVLKMSPFAFSRLSSTTTLDVIGPVRGQPLLRNRNVHRRSQALPDENVPPLRKTGAWG